MHHANLYISPDLDKKILPDYLSSGGVDVVEVLVDSLVIADVRKVIEQAYQKPVELTCREFVFIFSSATREAQNALLKLVEDPPATARFTFLLPHGNLLLPTLLSRLQLVDIASAKKIDLKKGEDTLAIQMDKIALAQKNKDKGWFQKELADVVRNPSVDHEVRLLIDRYKDTNGASRKMLLELATLLRKS